MALPYEDRPNRARRMRSWPLAERNGIVYLWHHWAGSGPDWEVPDVFESQGQHVAQRQYHDCHPHGEIRFGARTLDPYVVLDNAADPAHFKFVHHTKGVRLSYGSVRPDGENRVVRSPAHCRGPTLFSRTSDDVPI